MFNFLKLKKNNSICLIFGIIFIFSLSFGKCQAAAAWPDIIGASYKSMLDEMRYQIHGAILGALKQAAIQTINTTIGNLISTGGKSGGPMFVSNWKDFLYEEPLQETEIYMNDFFDDITGGKSNLSNYQNVDEWESMGQYFGGEYPEGVLGANTIREGVVKGDISWNEIQQNYENYLVQQAKKMTTEASIPKTNMREYVSDPSQMFKTGNWRAFSAFISNPANNPFGFTLISQDQFYSELSKNQEAKKTQGIAYKGFLPQKSGSSIVTPGSTIADIQSQVEDLGNKILAAAETPAEVITSLVTKLVTKTIRQGIGQVQQKVQREINSATSNFSKQIKSSSQMNPGQLYKPKY